MEVIRRNQLKKARELLAGQTCIVGFDDYNEFRSFSVQLSHYNSGLARERNLYIHAASKSKKYQYCLIAVSAEEHNKELKNSKIKLQWKKQLPDCWKTA